MQQQHSSFFHKERQKAEEKRWKEEAIREGLFTRIYMDAWDQQQRAYHAATPTDNSKAAIYMLGGSFIEMTCHK